MTFLKRFEPQIYALMRMAIGLLFMQYGLQKLFGFFGSPSDEISSTLHDAGGLIQLVGGLLVALGLFAAPAAFICSGSMAVAYFIIHQPEALFPIENHGDLAALYCWAFLPVAARGAGVWSVDAALSRRRR